VKIVSRDPIPRLQALLQAFKRFTGAPGSADASFEAHDDPMMPTEYGLPDSDSDAPGQSAAAQNDARAATPISVIIANCRGPESTVRCLAAVLAQRFDPVAFEVVIVDDSADDQVRAMVEALAPVGGAPAVRYLRSDGGGPIAARNHGWRAATGELIAFADDRSLPDPAWLAGGERAMRAGHLALGGSVCVPASRKHAMAVELQKLHATSAFVRRDALDRIGGFDERLATL
jgi:GT2 family glycosyltransferase